MARILRWTVPIDDLPHDIGGGPIVHMVMGGERDEIVVWTNESDVDKAHLYRRDVQVIVGAHVFPNDATVLGSVTLPLDAIHIWSLVEFAEEVENEDG